MTLRIDPRYTEHLFRPIYELDTMLGWAGGSLATLLIGSQIGIGLTQNIPYYLSAGMITTSAYYLTEALPLLKKQMALTTNQKTFMDIAQLRDMNLVEKRERGKLKNDPRDTYLGKGFNWGSEHAQRAYQVMDMDSCLSEVKIPIFLRPVVKRLSKETEELGGFPWIHGVGESKHQKTSEKTWFGHTLITGNVGTGKTTLLTLMSINALHMGNILIIIDPKNDDNWKSAIKKELTYLGKGDQFYHLHPAKQSESARIPLLKHYTRVTEIADRIAPLMGGKSGANPFEDFAYGIIYFTALGLDYLGEPIRLTSIQRVIASDRRGLATRVLHKYFESEFGEGWYEQLVEQLNDINPSDQLEAMAIYYNQYLAQKSPCKAVEGMLEFALHEEKHYSKMVVSLRPVLTALTAAPLDDLLSPIDDLESTDERPIVDIKTLSEKGGVLYISLDSMTDAKAAGYIARLALAEVAAVAGDRYNENDPQCRRITVANDEVHASIENNDSLLNLLAQGRAAFLQLILATQTISDLEAKTSPAIAKRFLGLCNNFISMRTTDPATQDYVASQFMKTSVTTGQEQSNSSSDTSSSILSFSQSNGQRLMKQREESFPGQLLGQLPVLQYIARLADGKTKKMKLPIITNNSNGREIAPWLQ